MRQWEACVAQQIRVSMLHTNSQLQMQPHYARFLQRLAAEAASRGELRSALLLF